MTVSTFFPDADTESTSVDGGADRRSVDETWATIKAGAGTNFQDSAATGNVRVEASSTTDQWALRAVMFFLFDTLALINEVVDSAVFEIVLTTKTDQFTDSITLTTSTPASNVAIEAADLQQVGTTKQATDLTVDSLTADSATFNTWTLNATGLGNISLTGITKFALRTTSDNDNSEPTWASVEKTDITVATAEEVLTDDKRPRLVVTHTPISTFLAGIWAMTSVFQPVLIPTGMRPY